MRLVRLGLNTLDLSPTRMIGPPPIGDSAKLREFSKQINRAVLGTLFSLQAAMAPINPISSARVRSTPTFAVVLRDLKISSVDSAAATAATSSQAGA